MDLAQGPVAHAARPLVRVELLANPAAEPDLVQPRAVADLDGEGARADLGEERAGIAFLDRVEAVLTVGDQPGENVEPACRALRIGKASDGRAKLELLDQRHEIDAAGLQHRTLGQVDLMEFELGELVAHSCVGTRKEARADTVSDLAQPEIEARRLDLVGLDLWRGHDLAGLDHGANGLAGQDAGAGEDAPRRLGGCGHVRALGQRLEERLCWWHGDVLGMVAAPGHLKLGLLPSIHKRPIAETDRDGLTGGA